MYSFHEREQIRSRILSLASADPRLSGGAVTGSASVGNEDAWSDIDLSFGVRRADQMDEVVGAYTREMYDHHAAVHHLDVLSGPWLYRVFFLASTLQVDLAFVPEEHFGAKGKTFQLRFGSSRQLQPSLSLSPEKLIGWAALYAVHVRSSVKRNRLLQAEYMLHGMRDQIVALATLRHSLKAEQYRGADDLPAELRDRLRDALPRQLDGPEINRAAVALTALLQVEAAFADPLLWNRLSKFILGLWEDQAPETAANDGELT